jgi:myo-inositol catabolism protein IolS
MKVGLLGKTGVKISAMGLGCWAFAGGSYWGNQEEQDSINTIMAAMEAGINFFDTAEMYGDGKSEEVVGKALQNHRDKVVIATKAASASLSAEKLIEACEKSLKRLKTDYIDLYQIHWPNRAVPFEETAKALEQLLQQGKVRALGVCNFGAQDIENIKKVANIITDQLPYSLLWRAIEDEIVPQCIKSDTGILCYSPLSQGLLTGKYKSPDEVPLGITGTRFYSHERSNARHGEPGLETETFDAISRIRKICKNTGESMGNITIAWLLQQKGVASVLVGARVPNQLRENIKAADIVLSVDILKELSAATDELKRKVGNNPDMWEGSPKSRFQ